MAGGSNRVSMFKNDASAAMLWERKSRPQNLVSILRLVHERTQLRSCYFSRLCNATRSCCMLPSFVFNFQNNFNIIHITTCGALDKPITLHLLCVALAFVPAIESFFAEWRISFLGNRIGCLRRPIVGPKMSSDRELDVSCVYLDQWTIAVFGTASMHCCEPLNSSAYLSIFMRLDSA